MSERLRSLTMRAFRGVPDTLTVELGDGRSLAALGENGTGKSTIADALEWYFTGEIELLAHEGRHEAIRNVTKASSDNTEVEVQTTGDLGGVVKYASDGTSKAAEAARKETFLLRGRTLADFINKSKTEKWKALAEILGFEDIEGLRQDLYKVKSALGKRVREFSAEREASGTALELTDATDEIVYERIYTLSQAAGIEPPSSLKEAFSGEWTASIFTSQQPDISKVASAQLLGELEATPRITETFEEAEQWNELLESEQGADLARFGLLREAERLLAQRESSECPLCGQAVIHSELTARIKNAVIGLRQASDVFESRREGVGSLIEATMRADGVLRSIRSRAEKHEIHLPEVPEAPSALRDLVSSRRPVPLEALRDYGKQVGTWHTSAKDVLESAVQETGGERDSSRLALIRFCETARAWANATEGEQRASNAKTLADRVYKLYEKRQQANLSGVLEKISKRVAEIYETLHPGEGLSSVTVEPWTAKGLELAINFYGSRQRPPHGVLSESHLNSLAIAFFLAMAETFNETFRFLVLDDVVNSFDLEHRGALASLLASEYEDWQLIVWTHDPLFFEQLVRRAPSWTKLEFTSWSHEEGPRTAKYETGGMLAKARASLEAGDKTAAAMKGRRALEELLQEICHGIGASLPFRRGFSNDRREIGELIVGLRHTLKDHAKGMYQELKSLITNLEADVAAALNVEAHASMGQAANAEVAAALARIQEFDSKWTCGDQECNTRIFHRGDKTSAMCKCTKSRYPPVPEN